MLRKSTVAGSGGTRRVEIAERDDGGTSARRVGRDVPASKVERRDQAPESRTSAMRAQRSAPIGSAASLKS